MSTMFTKGKFFKKLIAVVLVIVTMLPYFPISALAAENQNRGQAEDYYDFTAKWSNQDTTEKITTETGVAQTISIGASFSGGPVFKNMVISAKDVTEDTTLPAVNMTFSSMADTKNTGKSLVFTKPIAGGNSYSGSLTLNFFRTNDFSEYDKKIQITLEGEYVYNDETVIIEETRILEIHVVPTPIISQFTANASYSNSKAKRELAWYRSDTSWGVKNFETVCTLNLSGNNATYVNAKFKLHRTTEQDISAGLLNPQTIQMNKCDGYHYNISRESDGYTYITFTRGSQIDESAINDNTEFFRPSKIQFTVKYNIFENTHQNDDVLGYGETLFTGSVDVNIEGATKTVSKEGTEYKKSDYSYDMSAEQIVGIWSKSDGRTGNDYDVYFSARNQTEKELARQLQTDKLKVEYESDVYGTIGVEDEPDDARLIVYNYNRDGYIMNEHFDYRPADISRRSKVTYRVGQNSYSASIDTNQMLLNDISIRMINPWMVKKVEFYNINDVVDRDTPFYTIEVDEEHNITSTYYEVPEGTEIYEYYAVITGYTNGGRVQDLVSWVSTWSVGVDYLKNVVGEENVSKIRSISRTQESEYKNILYKYLEDERKWVVDYDSPNNSYVRADVQNAATAYFTFKEDSYESYCEFELNDYDGNINSLGSWDYDKEIDISFTPSTGSHNGKVVNNEEPKLFLELPNEYDYDNFRVTLDERTRGTLYIKKYEYEEINNKKYLVIDLGGTYNAEQFGGHNIIKVIHNRRLNTLDVDRSLTVYLYMITNNEGYTYGKTANNNNFSKEKDGITETPENLMCTRSWFSLSESDAIKVSTAIYNARGTMYSPELRTVNSQDKWSYTSKPNPLKMETGAEVKYESYLKSNEANLKDIDFIIRLPKASNTAIKNNNDDDFESTISLDLKSLGDIKVGVKVEDEELSLIDPSKYELLYSESENANYTDNYSTLDSNVDLSTVKTLRVKFNDFELEKGQRLIINYIMLMPNAEGISGAATAVRYSKGKLPQTVSERPILESIPAYVKHGNTKATLHLEKEFEGYAQGQIPAGETTLENIKFQLIDVETNEPLVLEGQTTTEPGPGSTTIEGIFKTNSEGKVTLTDVPEGTYKLVELSTFDKYRGIDYTQIVVENGVVQNDPIKVLNKLKTGDLIVHKEWEGTDIQPYDDNQKITLKLKRQGDLLSFDAKVNLDKDSGSLRFVGIPYGTYKISEESNVPSWVLDSLGTTVTIDSPEQDATEQEATVRNKMQRGTITIEKEMPGEDDVRDITLNITGDCFEYVNEDGVSVNFSNETTLNIGEYYNNPTNENISITLNDPTKPTKATITMSNMPVGTYTVKEINIPKIEGTDIDKYDPITKRGFLTDDTLLISLTNNWKTGTLKIRKTAEEGVDLTNFRVRVRMVNPKKYNTNYDQDFQIPASGILTIPGLYLGTYSITEYESDYFTPRYGDNQSFDPIQVEINENQTTEAVIYNQATYGYVKLYKSLEDKSGENTVGFKFKLSGKDATGKDITEVVDGQTVNGITREITSDHIETLGDGKKYGYVVFGPVQAGGDYQVSEVDTPEIYREMDPVQVDIKKTNTIDNPVIIKANNERKRGNLEMITRTVPEGGPLSPIKYKVTEITLNPDATTAEERMVKGDVVAELDGVAGYAELLNIYAGNYLVELTDWPKDEGYIGDLPQIVEVPDLGTGRAEFEIEKPDLQNTKLVIEKKFVNQNGEDLTADDFTKAKLDENEEFEAKVTNVTTGKVYYTFFSKNNPGIIKGLPAGDYEVEEIFKPKYTPEQAKYTVTIEEPVSQEQGSVATVTIKNLLNTNYGFGGQDSKNNLSKQTAEVINKTSRTVIYIADEDDDPVTGAEFKVYDSLGREVGLNVDDNKYVVSQDKRLIVNGLPVGRYTVKCLSVPEGYDKPADKVFDVYEGATLITRIEVLKTRPRGNLKLSTVYNKNGTEKNTPRSKYKIFDPVSGNVLTFEKTGDGNYIRSNKQDATDTISLKASSVIVKNIEVGAYEVGLVDLSEQYGVIKEQAEAVVVAQNQTPEIKVTVKERTGFKKVVTGYYGVNGIALKEDGELYTWHYSGNYELVKLSAKFPNIAGVKAKDVYMMTDGTIVIIDENGKLWSNYATGLPEGVSAAGIICLSDVENYPLYGLKFVKADIGEEANKVYAIDDSGRIWFWGSSNSYETQLVNQFGDKPICISNYGVLTDKEFVSIEAGHSSDSSFAVDTKGNVYAWGDFYDANSGIVNRPSNNDPICINTSEESNLANVKIKEVYSSYCTTFFIDNDDNLWVCGNYTDSYPKLGSETLTEDVRNPICLTTLQGNPLFGKKIKSLTTSKYDVAVTDETGKVWYWGYCSTNYHMGADGIYNTDIRTIEPTCLSTNYVSNIKDVRFKQLYTNSRQMLFGIDDNGSIWVLRGYYDGSIQDIELPLGTKNYITRQTKVDFPQNAYFDLFEVQDMSISQATSFIRDKSGRLWTPGNINTSSNSTYSYPVYNTNYSLVDYFGSELGAPLGDIKVKKYVCGDNSTLIIDENGKLWSIGQINNLYTQKSRAYTGYEQLEPICLTELNVENNILYGKTIVDIAVSQGAKSYNSYTGFQELLAVVDSDGNLYTAGYYNVKGLGYPGSYTDDSYYEQEFKCLNTMYSFYPKFKKVFVNGNQAVYAIDSDGALWVMGSTSDYYTMGIPGRPSSDSSILAPTAVFNAKKVVDVAGSSMGGILLVEDGSLFVWGDMIGNNNQSITTGFAPVNGQNTILEGKHFVKVAAGGNPAGHGFVMDDNGQIYQIYSHYTAAMSNITATINTDYGNLVAKDFYVGPNVVVIKDILDDIYVINNPSAIAGQGGTSAGSSVTKMSNTYGNQLYGKTISKQVSKDAVSVVENGVENIYVLDSTSGKVKGVTAVDGISSYATGRSYSVVFDNENHLYVKNGFFYTQPYQDVVISKTIEENDTYIIVEDTEGNSYKVYGTTVKKLENVQLKSVAYEDDNVIIMKDQNGKLYSVGDFAFRVLDGFDDNVEIKYIFTKKVYRANSSGTANYNVIYLQDNNNTLYVTVQDSYGEAVSGDEGNSDAMCFNGDVTYESKIKDLVNVYKVTKYTGGEVDKISLKYVSGEKNVFIIDKAGTVNTWGSASTNAIANGINDVLVNIVKFERNENREDYMTKLALDSNGNLYSWGTIHETLRNNGAGYWRIGDTSSTTKQYINLSTDGGIGPVKTFEYLPNGALVVNEDNEIYICLVGASPIKISSFTYDQVKEIYSKIDGNTYINFFIELNDGTKRNIFGDDYLGDVDVGYATPAEEPEPEPTPEVKSGLIVEDGKLYLYSDNGTTKICISDKASDTDVFAKQFKLIKDSKYKLN